MRTVTLREYDTICSTLASASKRRRVGQARILDAREFDALRRVDERMATSWGRRMFRWDEDTARATSRVGVLRSKRVQIEVVPKIDDAEVPGEEALQQARHNLMTMLVIAGRVPLEERDLALLSSTRAPLIDALILAFARRLEHELSCGVHHGYVEYREDLRCVRGRMDMVRQVTALAGRHDRVACVHERHEADTPLNRILKSASAVMMRRTRSMDAQRVLRRAQMRLSDVVDVELGTHLFDAVHLNRQTQRFAPLLSLARMLAVGDAPNMASGGTEMFALSFDINRVFEDFVVGFVRRHVLKDFPGLRLRPGAKGATSPLLKTQHPHRRTSHRLTLKPDLYFERGGEPVFLIDTKWKRLGDDKDRVALEDLYQLHTYLREFDVPCVTLLYPEVGASPYHYDVVRGSRRIDVRFVDVTSPLHLAEGRDALGARLREIIGDSLRLTPRTLVS